MGEDGGFEQFCYDLSHGEGEIVIFLPNIFSLIEKCDIKKWGNLSTKRCFFLPLIFLIILIFLIKLYFRTINTNNAVLTPVINGLTKVKKSGETANLDPISISIFGLKKSYLTKYLTYHGSSTTPPCSQVVTWLLCWDIQTVTSEQVCTFTEYKLLYSCFFFSLVGNMFFFCFI